MSWSRIWVPRFAIAGAFATLTGGALPAAAEQINLTLMEALAKRGDKAAGPPRMTPKPPQIADRCGATQYYCNNPTPVCCWSQSRGYYCVATLSQC